MNRHQFFKVVTAAALTAVEAVKGAVTGGKVTPTSVPTARKYPVPLTFWYENDNGEKWVPDLNEAYCLEKAPAGFDYMHCRETNVATHKIYGVRSKASDGSGLICSFSSTWHGDDLIMAMALKGGYRLHEAILIYTVMCERCMNVAAHEYGMTWGYAKGSAEYRKCPTECEVCKGPSR